MPSTQKVLAIASLLLLIGCAEMVKKTYQPTRGGVVKYSTGWFMGEKNREKAVEEMRGFCAPGRYSLLGEESRKESTGQSSSRTDHYGSYSSTNTTESKEGYVYLRFQCRK